MPQTLKIVIPMAGFGSRLRPLTWSRPKPLLPLAGKTVLDHFLDQFSSLSTDFKIEYIFIVGQQGEQISAYMQHTYPDIKVSYIDQTEMRGQSHAIWLAREHLSGPMLMAFSDTLIETDFSGLMQESCDLIAWVKEVEDPRRFGVAQLDANGHITRLIEKPQEMDNRLVVVGFYYFRSGETLVEAIEEQMRRGTVLNNEYFLADAINILLEKGALGRTQNIETWLDAGTFTSMLETNAYLLAHGHANDSHPEGVLVLEPSFIHPSAHVQGAIIGPNASIGENCVIENAIIRNSIVDANSQVRDVVLSDSLVGCDALIEGQAEHVFLGNNSWLKK